jgi:hypothetical protein
VSIPPATSTSLNNQPASPSDIFVPNFNMTRYIPMLYEHSYVFLDLRMFKPSSLITSEVSSMREIKSRFRSLEACKSCRICQLCVNLRIPEFIGIAHKNSVPILTSHRKEYAMLVKGSNWCKF